jgi:hypothetical protein
MSSSVPQQRGTGKSDAGRAPRRSVPARRLPKVPMADGSQWHAPGIHLVSVGDREVWVLMDRRGIVSTSSIGPEQLAHD